MPQAYLDSIQADFHGDNAKLIWPSAWMATMQSETYKF